MKYRLVIFTLLSALTVLTLRVSFFAHHSATATYIQGKTIKIEGTLREFIWRNPHSFMKVEARDDKGEMAMWVIEGAAPTQLPGWLPAPSFAGVVMDEKRILAVGTHTELMAGCPLYQRLHEAHAWRSFVVQTGHTR